MVMNDLSYTYDANSGQLILTISADPLQLFVSRSTLMIIVLEVGGLGGTAARAEVPESSNRANFAFLHKHRRCTSPNHNSTVATQQVTQLNSTLHATYHRRRTRSHLDLLYYYLESPHHKSLSQ